MVSHSNFALGDLYVLETDCAGRINDDQKEAYQHLNIVGLVGSIEYDITSLKYAVDDELTS